MSGSSTVVRLSSIGASVPIPVLKQGPMQLPPAIVATVSAGAILTFNVEVTGDDLGAAGYNPLTGNWNALETAKGLTASGNWPLEALYSAIRFRITQYGSGVLVGAVVQ